MELYLSRIITIVYLVNLKFHLLWQYFAYIKACLYLKKKNVA